MSKRNTVLYLLLACALLDVGLILARINEKPISYLHSWNQITTLAAIRAVTEKQAPFYRPQEVVTRLSWLAPGEQASLGNNSFTVYEEFPLYSIIVSAAAHRSVPLELISRCVSLIFWFIGAVSIYLLALGSFNVVSALTAAVVYLVSFPVLYYGQAVMADICMSSMMLVSVYLLDRWVQTGRRSCFLWGVAALSTAALFKSYAVFFVPIVIFARRARTKRVDAAAFLAAESSVLWKTSTG
ncbi:MAG TPA: glycosyltransferase family 39 protein, partial [Oligoflexia bacterium]|nr:glycosyltransferase family 39 protein [Oligoflexia bacterium]